MTFLSPPGASTSDYMQKSGGCPLFIDDINIQQQNNNPDFSIEMSEMQDIARPAAQELTNC
jgi:hypothetical protein